jgi:putative multiple sugar transport system permease protein
MVIALVFVIIVFQILTKGVMLRPLNITNIILQNSHIMVLSIGMLFVIVGGDFDLSVGSLAGLVGAITGAFAVIAKVNPIVSIAIALLAGALAGAWQGLWIAFFRVPAFVVTLGGMLIFRGLMLMLLGSNAIGPFPESFKSISSAFIPDFSGQHSLKWVTVIVGVVGALAYVAVQIRARRSQRKYGFEVVNVGVFLLKIISICAVTVGFVLILASYEGIPNVLVLLALMLLIYSFLGNRTVIGRRVYAMGGSEKAALLSGVNTKRVKFAVFVNMGLIAGVAGIIFAARLNYATPMAGTGFELDAIAACFIGGASSSGGVGRLSGALIGALIMGVMNNGMSIVGLGVDFQQAIKGLVLIFAVLFDVTTRSRATK